MQAGAGRSRRFRGGGGVGRPALRRCPGPPAGGLLGKGLRPFWSGETGRARPAEGDCGRREGRVPAGNAGVLASRRRSVIMRSMDEPGLPAEMTGEGAFGELAEAGVYPTAAAGFEHGLVVLAMGRPYWLVYSPSGYRLLVDPPALAPVREELACFERESAGWPPQPAGDHPPSLRAERFTPLVWAIVVLAAYAAQGGSPGAWEDAGALDSQAVFDRGEWWRAATALFLHADLGHVLGNVVSGTFVFSALLSAMGRLRGWLLLGLAAVAGNLAAAALNYPGPYRSIGASTAVFAGLGLLTGRSIRMLRGEDGRRRWRAVLVPLAAGVALLGLFGAGGLHADVTAHATGFAAGLALGFSAGKTRRKDAGGDG